jgi:hypothetical protein
MMLQVPRRHQYGFALLPALVEEMVDLALVEEEEVVMDPVTVQMMLVPRSQSRHHRQPADPPVQQCFSAGSSGN